MSQPCSKCGAISVWMCSLSTCPMKNQLDEMRSKFRDSMGIGRIDEEKEENVKRQQATS